MRISNKVYVRIRGVSLFVMLLCFLFSYASATIILTVHTVKESVVIGNDSLVTDITESTNEYFAVQKTFRVSPFCLLSTGGNYGNQSFLDSAGPSNSIPYLNLLSNLCSSSLYAPYDIHFKISNIASNVSDWYSKQLRARKFVGRKILDVPTLLSFAGYDDSRHAFFNMTYCYHPTNAMPTAQSQFADDSLPNATPSIVHFGNEMSFMYLLLIEPSRLVNADKAHSQARRIYHGEHLNDAEMEQFIVECFRIYDAYDANAHIGEPYVIHKITTNGITRIR